MYSNIGWYQGIETEFFDGDSELRKLTFVGLDHVRMGLADLLELSLDALDGFIFDIFDLVESRADQAKVLGVDIRSCENLVDRRLLCVKALLDGLNLLLQDKVTQASLLMHLIDQLVELIE
jgi:hypothetical protein